MCKENPLKCYYSVYSQHSTTEYRKDQREIYDLQKQLTGTLCFTPFWIVLFQYDSNNKQQTFYILHHFESNIMLSSIQHSEIGSAYAAYWILSQLTIKSCTGNMIKVSNNRIMANGNGNLSNRNTVLWCLKWWRQIQIKQSVVIKWGSSLIKESKNFTQTMQPFLYNTQ
jgi:hypothetical protein